MPCRLWSTLRAVLHFSLSKQEMPQPRNSDEATMGNALERSEHLGWSTQQCYQGYPLSSRCPIFHLEMTCLLHLRPRRCWIVDLLKRILAFSTSYLNTHLASTRSRVGTAYPANNTDMLRSIALTLHSSPMTGSNNTYVLAIWDSTILTALSSSRQTLLLSSRSYWMGLAIRCIQTWGSCGGRFKLLHRTSGN